jgi:hypothetical protein
MNQPGALRPRLPDFRLETFFSRWEFAATHHLTASDAQTLTVTELLALGDDADREAFDSLALGYTETWGTARLRQAVAATYGSCGPEDVLAFAGAEEAIFWAMQLLVGPGDHVVVTVPNYQALETVPRAGGADVTGVLLDAADGWRLDLDAVRAALRPDTRLIAVTSRTTPPVRSPTRTPGAPWSSCATSAGSDGSRTRCYRGLELDPARTPAAAADLSRTPCRST